MNVWVVDDSALQADACRRALAGVHDVEIFVGGAAVIEALAGRRNPDVLVVDWHMPDISGLDVSRFVRTTRNAGQLPILIVTATGTDDSLLEAFAAGVNDFMTKPVDPAELEARVAALGRNAGLHARLAEAERRLRVEGEFREQFLAILAHDLRQPLHSFVLANRMLSLAPTLSAGDEECLAIQRRASERMERMIHELLDFTRIRPETGMPVSRRPVSMEAVVQGVIEEMRLGQPTRTIALEVVGDCEGEWDHDRLAQICSNLIGNALEHSSSSTSTVEVRLTRRSGHVELAVKNQGKPIPPEHLSTVFAPFRRLEGAPKTGGVGLGLHIVSEIVRAHQGSIGVESDDRGTVFSVRLPVAAAPSG